MLFSVESNADQCVCRKIVRDVGPTLVPDEELADLAAAESTHFARLAEREVTVNKLQQELRRECGVEVESCLRLMYATRSHA